MRSVGVAARPQTVGGARLGIRSTGAASAAASSSSSSPTPTAAARMSRTRKRQRSSSAVSPSESGPGGADKGGGYTDDVDNEDDDDEYYSKGDQEADHEDFTENLADGHSPASVSARAIERHKPSTVKRAKASGNLSSGSSGGRKNRGTNLRESKGGHGKKVKKRPPPLDPAAAAATAAMASSRGAKGAPQPLSNQVEALATAHAYGFAPATGFQQLSMPVTPLAASDMHTTMYLNSAVVGIDGQPTDIPSFHGSAAAGQFVSQAPTFSIGSLSQQTSPHAQVAPNGQPSSQAFPPLMSPNTLGQFLMPVLQSPAGSTSATTPQAGIQQSFFHNGSAGPVYARNFSAVLRDAAPIAVRCARLFEWPGCGAGRRGRDGQRAL